MISKTVFCVLFLFIGSTLGRKLSRRARGDKDAEISTDYYLAEEELNKRHEHEETSTFRRTITSAIHDYGVEIYNVMGQDIDSSDNIAISPLSLYVALGMISSGTAGQTKAQSMRVMNVGAMEDVHLQMKHLLTALNTTDNTATTGAEITIANKVYIDRGMRLYKYFKSILKYDYMSTAKKVDFATFPEKSRGKMNQFVAKQTNNVIRQLVPEGTVDSMTKLFAINALYLKAGWMSTFRTAPRAQQDFEYGYQNTMRVQMMRNSGPCYYEFDRRLQVSTLRLQMKGGISMLIMMPHMAGDFSALQLNDKSVAKNLIDRLYGYPMNCAVTMPKFKVEYSVPDLIATQQTMGLTDIFNASRADFSKMTPMTGIYVHDVRHKTAITVNEFGIEAAAATSYGVTFRMVPTRVLINKPFMFFIRHDKTGANLFMGRIVKPGS